MIIVHSPEKGEWPLIDKVLMKMINITMLSKPSVKYLKNTSYKKLIFFVFTIEWEAFSTTTPVS